MKLTDILKLDKNVESLNIIQSFLNQPLSYDDYIKATDYYLEIANINNLDDLVLDEGLKTLNKFINQKPTKEYQNIYANLIDSSIKLEKFELASNYILKRKEVLSIMDQYLSIIDEIKLNEALNKDIYNLLQQLLIEIIPHDIKTFALEKVLEIYINTNKFISAISTIDELINHTNNHSYETEKLLLYYKLKNYEQVITLAEKILASNYENVTAAVLLIIGYSKTNKLIKASTLEAEFEEIIDTANDDIKTLAYEEIIDLYKKIDNKLSIDLYTKKLNKLKRSTKKQTEEPILESKTKKQEVITVEVYKDAPKSGSVLKYLENHELLNTWLIKSHLINEKLALREYLRQILIEVSEKLNFIEAIIYIEDAPQSNFFNYKKERLYDKKIIKQYVEDTIISDTLKTGEPIFGLANNLKQTKNVLTQKPFTEDIKFIYAFPLDKNTAMVFYLDEALKDPSTYYEIYEGVSTIIYTKLLDIKVNERLLIDTTFYQQIIDNSTMPIRILTENKSLYNNAATSLLDIDYNYHLELFLRDVDILDVTLYNNTIKRLLNYPNEVKSIKYKYQEKVITEHLYAVVKNNVVHIISFFIDITTHIDNEQTLTKEAILDAETNLKNLNCLNKELNNYLDEKVTFILIELDQSLKPIYGAPKLNDYFVEFATLSKIHFKESEIYRFDFNQILIILNYNDIRTVDKTMREYLSVLLHHESKVLPFEKFKVSAGVLRYPVVTSEKNSDKIYRYLDIALNKAKNDRESSYRHFIFKDYEDEVFEQQVIDYLNVAIENKQLSLYFKQIIDLKNNKIWQYESELILPNINIDNKYLNVIAKRRKRIVELEHYHIEAVCEFLQTLEKETNRLIKLTIPISSETFLKSDFQGFLIGTLKNYKIPAEFIRIITDVDIKDKSNSLKIEEIINFGISLDTKNLNTALSHDFHALHLDLKNRNAKWINYLKNINIFLNNNQMAFVVREVNTNEDKELMKNIGINYIEGTLYRKLYSNKLLEKIKESI